MAKKNETEERKISLLQNDPKEKCQARVISELMSLYEANCLKSVKLKKHLASSREFIRGKRDLSFDRWAKGGGDHTLRSRS